MLTVIGPTKPPTPKSTKSKLVHGFTSSPHIFSKIQEEKQSMPPVPTPSRKASMMTDGGAVAKVNNPCEIPTSIVDTDKHPFFDCKEEII